MRFFLLATALTATSFAATPRITSVAGAMRMFADTATRVACAELRKETKTCAVKLTSATRNALGADSAMWAFTASVSATLSVKGEPRDKMRISLESESVQVMEPNSEGFTIVAYFREDAGQFGRVSTNVFAAAALNPVDKVVARYDVGFLQTSGLTYALPQVWSTQGVSPGSQDNLSLRFTLPAEESYAIALFDLDDSPLKDLNLENCQLSTGASCDAGAVALPAGTHDVTLRLAAKRKIKGSQPAFKLVVRSRKDNTAILQLAIPFKPQPNYFLFGVTGFLFGGLIAVMVLFLKRKPAK